MEEYERHLATAAENNLRMMGHADRSLRLRNLGDLHGHAREMRLHGEQLQYELNLVLETAKDAKLKRHVEHVSHIVAQAIHETGCAINDRDIDKLHQRAAEVLKLGQQVEGLLGEATALSAGT